MPKVFINDLRATPNRTIVTTTFLSFDIVGRKDAGDAGSMFEEKHDHTYHVHIRGMDLGFDYESEYAMVDEDDQRGLVSVVVTYLAESAMNNTSPNSVATTRAKSSGVLKRRRVFK